MRSGVATAPGLPTDRLWAALAALALAAGPAAVAQQPSAASITGRITEAGSGAPVAGAVVGVEGTTLSSVADASGRYRLAGIPPGPQVILVIRIGFAPLRHSLVVPGTGTLTLDLALGKSA